MSNLATLLKSAGFRKRAGASLAAVARMEKKFGVQLPDEFRELWAYSNGMDGDDIELLAVAEVEKYAGIFTTGFGYVPFTECNNSNPYAVCCREPLAGVIAHIFHDDESHLVCGGLKPFLKLVAEAHASAEEVDQLTGAWAFDRPERPTRDAATARKLVRAAEKLDTDDPTRGEGLRFAAQLFGPGQEKALQAVAELGDEYVREAVQRRLKVLGTPAAKKALGTEEAAYKSFLKKFQKAFAAAGVKTEPTRQGAFCLRPGPVHLNFEMIYADFKRRPDSLEEWVGRLKERLRKK